MQSDLDRKTEIYKQDPMYENKCQKRPRSVKRDLEKRPRYY